MSLVNAFDKLKSKPTQLRPGDRVKVHTRIVEGDRERIQVFQGTVMRKRKGGAHASFTVRRVASHGIGVERTFLLHSPRIEKIEVAGHSHVRRAQLYYLRGRKGKAARMRELRIPEEAQASEAPKAAE
jgi:large subunit ribosomal protein L19